eukprot:jgi/Botrbrau1/18403/Bobra.0869s0001.1
MEEGDVLYMPRGFVHEAVAADSLSVHVTLSTAQHWSGAVLLHHLLPSLESEGLPQSLRHSLPPAFLYKYGACQGPHVSRSSRTGLAARHKGEQGAAPQVVSRLAQGLRELAARLEGEGATLLGPAADALATEFMACRAPPHPAQLLPQGPLPSKGDAVFCRDKTLFRIVPVPDESSHSTSGLLKVASSLHNKIEQHMMGCHHARPGHHQCTDSDCCTAEHGTGCGASASASDSSDSLASEVSHGSTGDDDEGEWSNLIFPACHEAALYQLLSSDSSTPVQVTDVLLSTQEERLHFVQYLWKNGALCTVSDMTSPSHGKGGAHARRRKSSKRAMPKVADQQILRQKTGQKRRRVSIAK